MEFFRLILFNGFWVFIGGTIIIYTIASAIVDLIRMMLSPFQKNYHLHINGEEADMDKFKEFIENN